MSTDKELKELIRSYPAEYSAKEIRAVLWAEMGLIVSDSFIEEARS